MNEVQITAIRKSGGSHNNPHEAISDFKWVSHTNGKSGISTRLDMVSYIENGDHAYVSSGSNRAYCYVRSNGRIKFLQTAADGQYTNNLLSLPEF